MMPDSRNLLSGIRKYLWGALLVFFASVISLAFSMSGSNDFDTARREVLLRQIGHELLLQSGDHTSRVLPVKKMTENEYQISFEHAFTFQPDSLINTTQRLLSKDPLTGDYIVNVLNCGKTAVVYGYAMSENKKQNIVACRGRKQPRACYLVNIKFKPSGINTSKTEYLLGGLSFLAFAGLVFFRSVKPRRNVPESEPTGLFTLGAVVFDDKNRKLIINGNTTELTGTETRVLRIFALSPNQVIERSRLQKEIWEDEGVIVGRSLDMFISKLRKKLEFDPDIRIVVIRGKGYKLDISA
jgi:hypothetical protein